jgi:hypothetical protein
MRRPLEGGSRERFRVVNGEEEEYIERRAAHFESVDIEVSIDSIQWIYLPLRTPLSLLLPQQ